MMEKPYSDENDLVKENTLHILEAVEAAKKAAGRTDAVQVMAVTKTVAPEKVNIALACGISLLGENRVQEFLSKHELYSPRAEIHFIGGLQNNKVKYIINKVKMIHSVDSDKLLFEISRRAQQHGLTMDVLLEINIGGEDSKNGIHPESVQPLLEQAVALPSIRVRGLMTIPPPDQNGSAERDFTRMKRLFDTEKERLSQADAAVFDTLSMGMSQDYEQAVRCGSTLVRIGSALFGKRIYT